jgi:phosphohistidine phosphatase
MKVYLIHHAHAVTAEENPSRPLSDQGRTESDRLVARLKAVGAKPQRILHSDKLWTQQTAERVAAGLGGGARPALAAYPIGTDDPLAPFMADIAGASGDIAMAGHVDYLVRSAAKLVTSSEARPVVEFKPGNGTVFCLEGSGDNWVVAWGWRQEQLGA